MAPITHPNKVTLANIRKSNILAENLTSKYAKRKAENSPPKGNVCKKPTYNDIENEKHKSVKNGNAMITRSRKNQINRPPLKNIAPNAMVKPRVESTIVLRNNTSANVDAKKVTAKTQKLETVKPTKKSKLLPKEEPTAKIENVKSEEKLIIDCEKKGPVTRSSTRLSASRKSLSTEKSDESTSLYVSALEEISTSIQEKCVASNRVSLSEFDKELLHDPHQVSLYAMEIFEYLKSREAKFPMDDYMSRQPKINAGMRAVLVDWMVEVQESFELNHETLYLAVKIVDSFLCKVKIEKQKLQLVAAAALFLACKYDERLSPLIDDFIYVCDNAYSAEDLLAMEQNVLRNINFELSFPISYSFLRRYARCARIQMPLLTLARYILELGLMEYKTVTLSDSKQAAAALYLAFKMVKHDDWNEKLVFYTGYTVSDFKNIVLLYNRILHKKPIEDLSTIRKKYSHELFFKVALTPLISDGELGLDK